MGFFALETVPRLGEDGASLRRMGEVERCLLCVVVRWTRFRESERERTVEVIVVGSVLWLGVSRTSRVLTYSKYDSRRSTQFRASTLLRTMPPKRKNDDTGEPSARERKKVKMADARTIAVQEPTPAATLTANQANAVASSSTGPSKTAVQFDCTYPRALFCRRPVLTVLLAMQGLPASIDVERFTEARLFYSSDGHGYQQSSRRVRTRSMQWKRQ